MYDVMTRTKAISSVGEPLVKYVHTLRTLANQYKMRFNN